MITRRSFLKQSTLLAAGAYLHGQLPSSMRHHPVAQQQIAFDTSKLEKFVDPLPIPAVAQAQGKRPSPADQRGPGWLPLGSTQAAGSPAETRSA